MPKIKFHCNCTPFKGKDQQYHYVYRIDNLINGRYYLGLHSTKNLDDNYRGSGKFLKMAIKKHGIDNFHKTILQFADSRDDLHVLEEQVVGDLWKNDCRCYNCKPGGDCCPIDASSFKQINGKKVICLETGIIYDTLIDLAKDLGASTPKSHELNRKTLKGKHYALYEQKYDDEVERLLKIQQIDDQIKQRFIQSKNNLKNSRKRRWICLETKQIFEDVYDAKTSLNSAGMGRIIQLNEYSIHRLHKQHYMLYNNETYQQIDDILSIVNKYNNRPKKPPYQSIHVRCVETGQEFDNCRAASKAVNRSLHGVEQAVRSGGTCAGYHWVKI